MVRIDEDRLELFAPPQIAANRQRAQRIAVVALQPRDEMTPLRLADFKKKLPRQLQGGLDRLGPSGYEIDLLDPLGCLIDQQRGQTFGRFVGEK